MDHLAGSKHLLDLPQKLWVLCRMQLELSSPEIAAADYDYNAETLF